MTFSVAKSKSNKEARRRTKVNMPILQGRNAMWLCREDVVSLQRNYAPSLLLGVSPCVLATAQLPLLSAHTR